jgi:pimeloyl-ACP methyl ester carboxylesterase
MREHDVVIRSAVDVAGTLCLPEGADPAAGASPAPAVLLIGGTGADTRDGDLEAAAGPDGTPAPGTLRQLAHRLAHEGIASLRWDRRGFGQSGGERADNDYDTDVEDALACLRWARGRPEIDPARVAVAGHSAGALVVCLVCRDAPGEVAAAGLLGALSTPIEDMLRANLGLLTRRWDELTAEQQAWLAAERPAQLLRAEGLERVIEAARRGDEAVRLEGHGLTLDVPTRRLRQDIERSYEAEMRHVQCPALVLHGGDDLNVGVENALVTYRALRDAGNERVHLVVLPGLEHYFCPVSAEASRRVWERLSLEALHQPMAAEALDAIASWARSVLDVRPPSSVSGR